MEQYYPEGCDTTGLDCVQCVRNAAEAVRGLTGAPAADWAAGVFGRMYTHAACRQMEHTFLWACGGAASELIQIAAAA